MANMIADQLRTLAAQIEAANVEDGSGARPRAPAATGSPDQIQWSPDGTALADWWVKGYLGCMKGAHNRHYAEAHVIMGLQAGEIPRHLSIIQAIPASLPWSVALVSAADCGWIDGSGYNPEPKEGSFQRWIGAGCPSKNGNAVYDVRGQPIPAGAWQAVYTQIASHRRQGTGPGNP